MIRILRAVHFQAEDCPKFDINSKLSLIKQPNTFKSQTNPGITKLFVDRQELFESLKSYIPEEISEFDSKNLKIFSPSSVGLPEKEKYLLLIGVCVNQLYTFLYASFFDYKGQEIKTEDYVGVTKVPGVIRINDNDGNPMSAGPKDAQLFLSLSNEAFFMYNMIDKDLYHKVGRYSFETGYSLSLTYIDNVGRAFYYDNNWTPLSIENDNMYFVFNYENLQIIDCKISERQCKVVSGTHDKMPGTLRGGSPYVQFGSTNYYVSMAYARLDRTCNVYRPSLAIISFIEKYPYFKLIYTSEPIDFGKNLFLEVGVLDICNNTQKIAIPSINSWSYEDDIVDIIINLNDEIPIAAQISGLTKFVENVIDLYEKGKLPAERNCAVGFLQSYYDISMLEQQKAASQQNTASQNPMPENQKTEAGVRRETTCVNLRANVNITVIDRISKISVIKERIASLSSYLSKCDPKVREVESAYQSPAFTYRSSPSIYKLFTDRYYMYEVIEPYIPKNHIMRKQSKDGVLFHFQFPSAIWLPEKNVFLAVVRIALDNWYSLLYVTYFDSEWREIRAEDYIGKTKIPGVLKIKGGDGRIKWSGPEDGRIYRAFSDEIFCVFNMVDENEIRKMYIYSFTTGESRSLNHDAQVERKVFVEKNGTPLIVNTQHMYFLYNYKNLQIIDCTDPGGKCTSVAGEYDYTPGTLRGGSPYVQFASTNYYVSMAYTHLDINYGCRLYRPSLTVIYVNPEEPTFKLIYTSDPLEFGGDIFLKPFTKFNSLDQIDKCDLTKTMMVVSIANWRLEDDIVDLTINMNDTIPLAIKVSGLTGFVQNIINLYEKNELPAENNCAEPFLYDHFSIPLIVP